MPVVYHGTPYGTANWGRDVGQMMLEVAKMNAQARQVEQEQWSRAIESVGESAAQAIKYRGMIEDRRKEQERTEQKRIEAEQRQQKQLQERFEREEEAKEERWQREKMYEDPETYDLKMEAMKLYRKLDEIERDPSYPRDTRGPWAMGPPTPGTKEDAQSKVRSELALVQRQLQDRTLAIAKQKAELGAQGVTPQAWSLTLPSGRTMEGALSQKTGRIVMPPSTQPSASLLMRAEEIAARRVRERSLNTVDGLSPEQEAEWFRYEYERALLQAQIQPPPAPDITPPVTKPPGVGPPINPATPVPPRQLAVLDNLGREIGYANEGLKVLDQGVGAVRNWMMPRPPGEVPLGSATTPPGAPEPATVSFAPPAVPAPAGPVAAQTPRAIALADAVLNGASLDDPAISAAYNGLTDPERQAFVERLKMRGWEPPPRRVNRGKGLE